MANRPLKNASFSHLESFFPYLSWCLPFCTRFREDKKEAIPAVISVNHAFSINRRDGFYIYGKVCKLRFLREDFPNSSAQSCTDKRTYNENPELVQSCTSLKDSRGNTAGRIYRSTRVADTSQMNQYE